MLPSHSDRTDSDPLLEFSSEPERAAPPAQTSSQPADAPSVALIPAGSARAVESLDPLRKRIDFLERSLSRATKDIAGLNAQLTTLVISQREMKPRSNTIAAAAGLVAGLGLALALWMYVSSSEPAVVGATAQPPAAESPAAATPGPAATPVEAAPQPESLAPKPPAPAQSAREVPKQVAYVGTLSIDASADANVFVDRQEVGHTPLRLENIKAGSHLVWIERDGYRRWTRVIEVPADRVSRAFADLEPIASR